jgi:hypothetical protein
MNQSEQLLHKRTYDIAKHKFLQNGGILFYTPLFGGLGQSPRLQPRECKTVNLHFTGLYWLCNVIMSQNLVNEPP